MKCQALNIIVSSAAFVIGAFRVTVFLLFVRDRAFNP